MSIFSFCIGFLSFTYCLHFLIFFFFCCFSFLPLISHPLLSYSSFEIPPPHYLLFISLLSRTYELQRFFKISVKKKTKPLKLYTNQNIFWYKLFQFPEIHMWLLTNICCFNSVELKLNKKCNIMGTFIAWFKKCCKFFSLSLEISVKISKRLFLLDRIERKNIKILPMLWKKNQKINVQFLTYF